MEEKETGYVVAIGRGIITGITASMITSVFAWALCDFFQRPLGLSAVLLSLGFFVPGYFWWDGESKDDNRRVLYQLTMTAGLFVGLVLLLRPVAHLLGIVVKLL